jgi:NAD(P)-dependent dehydrogenase (short-subunit alcohol dehydrogenase family)
MRLENKVALITGGYGGMGRASARLFAQEGATVFVAGRDRERGDALVKEINDNGGKASFTALDVVDQDQWDAAVAQVKDQAGALHVLMNIVGSNALTRFPAIDIDDFNEIFEINVTATARGIQTCAPLIRDSGANFSTAYSASKWALEGLSRSAAYVYSDWGIRSNVIQPGWIETDMTAKATKNPIFKKAQGHVLANQVLLRRPGKAEDIGYTALFLASDESAYITGTDIVVDGGWFSSAPYLVTERSHHALKLMDAKEKAEHTLDEFLQHFR